ncbi:hypothetical protein GCM10023340_19020 [Nocardioides marinquilinus]|uniref:Cholesterol esterase n=1 Tax=Nocardioides marinquilinus TaxID=1210400 RepID=A0ABP9PIN0_9ACTN
MPITAARYAAVTATLALAVALGGTSYAATQVGTKQLRNGAVTTAKLANGAVTGAKVKNDSLTGADVKEGSLGKVPRAGQAVSARSAERAVEAERVGRVSVVDVVSSRLVEQPGRPSFPINAAGLHVELTCETVSNQTRLGLTATTDLDGGSIVTVGDSDSGTVGRSDLEDGAFASGVTFDLLAGDDGDITQLRFTYRSAAGGLVQGTLFTDLTYNEPFIDADDVCSVQGFVLTTPDPS